MNWWYVGTNAIWIIALAWGIAVLGISYWESIEKRKRLQVILTQPQKLVSLTLALMCFSFGLGLTTSETWGKVLWFFLAIACVFVALKSARIQREKK
jgi:hypothetical protein